MEFNIVSKNILLVDDEEDIILALNYILEGHGFKVDTFNDPITALKSYKTNFYDLVILDIKVPKMDGFELYAKIREKDSVKICFLTSTAIFTEEHTALLLKLDKNIDEVFLFKSLSQVRI